MKKYEKMTVGQIVADRFANARIFDKYGIDFCCNGSDTLDEACRKRNVRTADILKELESPENASSGDPAFKEWPLDLLCDYIIKFHHRNIRREGPEISALLEKVCNVHGERHAELFKVKSLFADSLQSLYEHLDKEEIVLFPYIYAMCDAREHKTQIPPFHCGSIAAPISVMMAEHEEEGVRYREIATLCNDYRTPDDGCGSYRLLMDKLRSFDAALHQHIHLENNIAFPESIELERQLFGHK